MSLLVSSYMKVEAVLQRSDKQLQLNEDSSNFHPFLALNTEPQCGDAIHKGKPFILKKALGL